MVSSPKIILACPGITAQSQMLVLLDHSERHLVTVVLDGGGAVDNGEADNPFIHC